jgi:hypothetical protein
MVIRIRLGLQDIVCSIGEAVDVLVSLLTVFDQLLAVLDEVPAFV